MKFTSILISAFIVYSAGVLISNGVSAASISVGDDVTLNTGVRANQQYRIKWYFSDIRIAQINGGHETCTGVKCNTVNERFRDRLKLNHETGSLTVTNITVSESGLYKLQIISSRSREESFNISVRDDPGVQVDQIKALLVKEGESVTIDSGVIKNPNDTVMWLFNDVLIAEMTGDQIQICADDRCKERFSDRLKVDHQTGSLTITNTRTTDSLVYELRIITGNISILKRFDVTIDLHIETPAYLGFLIALCVAMILASFAGFFFLCWKIKRPINKYEVDTMSVTEGETVTLKTDSNMKKKAQIQWTSEDGNDLLTEMKAGAKMTRDFAVEKFKDRLKLDKKTGSLTISDLKTSDSGVYKLEVSKCGKKTLNLFSVSVFARSVSVMEGVPVRLNIDQTEEQNADQILWTFGPERRCTVDMNNVTKKLSFYNDPANEKFKNRLQLDDQTGSLTTDETKATDSGVYELNFINKEPSLKLFSVSGPTVNRSM